MAAPVTFLQFYAQASEKVPALRMDFSTGV
jgi:hypothetical protein